MGFRNGWLGFLVLSTLSVCAYAEDTPSEQAGVKPLMVSSKEKSAPIAKEEKPQTKKAKPHFAGARRVPDIKKDAEPLKPKKVKSPWFLSKTQPKAEKKEIVYEEVTQLPKDHPHFVKTKKRILLEKNQDTTE